MKNISKTIFVILTTCFFLGFSSNAWCGFGGWKASAGMALVSNTDGNTDNGVCARFEKEERIYKLCLINERLSEIARIRKIFSELGSAPLSRDEVNENVVRYLREIFEVLSLLCHYERIGTIDTLGMNGNNTVAYDIRAVCYRALNYFFNNLLEIFLENNGSDCDFIVLVNILYEINKHVIFSVDAERCKGALARINEYLEGYVLEDMRSEDLEKILKLRKIIKQMLEGFRRDRIEGGDTELLDDATLARELMMMAFGENLIDGAAATTADGYADDIPEGIDGDIVDAVVIGDDMPEAIDAAADAAMDDDVADADADEVIDEDVADGVVDAAAAARDDDVAVGEEHAGAENATVDGFSAAMRSLCSVM